MSEGLNKLKRDAFYEFLNSAGRAFILVGYADDVVIGKRGFRPEEKEKGIILVLNSRMNFTWDDDGITVTLVFGNTPEKCFIPIERIQTVFSPELNAQLAVGPRETKPEKAVPEPGEEEPPSDDKIVRVDFRKKK